MTNNPWKWVPTLYFAEGIPFVLINSVSMVLFTQLGMSETDAALYTGWLYLPWVIKPFWSPIIDIVRSKRWWIILMQSLVAFALAGIAFTLPLPEANQISLGLPVNAFAVSLAFYVVTSLCSATNDIASDGFYMIALDSNHQSFFVGIRSMFYRIANLFGKGGLVIIAGLMETSYGVAQGWRLTVAGCAVLFGVLSVYHAFILPRPESDNRVGTISSNDSIKNVGIEFIGSFIRFFQKRHVIGAIIFMLLYRLPEAQVVKLCQPFLLASRDAGGLDMTQAQVGFVYGALGIIGLTVGGVVGGICASRGGLRRWLWPMAFAISLNCVAYISLSVLQPSYGSAIGKIIIYSAVIIEQLAYGFGFTAFMLFMMYFSEGEYATSHYSLCTAFMALGMMLPGMCAGWIKETLLGNSYTDFFIWVLVCNIATWIVTAIIRPHINPSYGVKQQ